MNISMHNASVGVYLKILGNLDTMLEKTEKWTADRKIDPNAILLARLAPDMFTFTRQVQIATDMAKGCAARLAGVDVPKYDDTETTFAELKARIAKTVAFIESFKADQLDGAEARTIQLKTGGREVTFSGRDYLFGFVYPNVFFHLTTAYNILRHNGVELGKMDLLG